MIRGYQHQPILVALLQCAEQFTEQSISLLDGANVLCSMQCEAVLVSCMVDVV